MKRQGKRRQKTVANKAEKTKRTISFNTLKQNIVDMSYYLDAREFLSDDEIKKIEEDATVISSLSIRKSATLKKELMIVCQNEKVKEELAKCISFSFREQALDTHLQGMSVFELVWYQKEGLWFPLPQERDYKDFELSHTDPLKHIITQAFVPPHKAIVGLYSPKYNRLHGRSLYQPLFWLTKFKNASIDFWVEYMQRFSSPWVVGTTQGDKDEMAENLYAMLGGDVAVVEDEDKIDLITPQIKGDFKELSTYADDQIREILLGGNLLGETKGGSLAASQTHKEVLDGIAMMDEHILQKLIDDILALFKEINSFTEELTIAIKDKDAENNERAKRDLDIYNMTGGKYLPTKIYLEKTYGIELEDATQAGSTPNKPPFAFSATPKEDFLTSQEPGAKETLQIERSLLGQIEKAFASATSFEEAQEKLLALYTEFDASQIQDLLTQYIANADILGRVEIESENPHG